LAEDTVGEKGKKYIEPFKEKFLSNLKENIVKEC
jgi:hypothetical protein